MIWPTPSRSLQRTLSSAANSLSSAGQTTAPLAVLTPRVDDVLARVEAGLGCGVESRFPGRIHVFIYRRLPPLYYCMWIELLRNRHRRCDESDSALSPVCANPVGEQACSDN